MRDTTTLTVKLPSELHQKVLEKIIVDKYGMRGKSKWIIEALQNFLDLQDFPVFVEIVEEMGEMEMKDIISVRIPSGLYTKLEEAVVEVRKWHPAMEGVKSKIIRASLMQRLIRF